MNNTDAYRQLMTKDIYAILDGDESFGEYESQEGKKIKIGLPYLSGPVLCDISTKFGKPVSYVWGSGAPSRWTYVEDLLNHCIDNGTCSALLKYLFSRSQFKETLQGLNVEEIQQVYKISVNKAIDGINRKLLFSRSKLVFRDKKFIIIPITKEILADDEMLENIFNEDYEDPFSSLHEYKQCEKIGQGGFGEVYRYHNNNLDMDFAVKI